MEKNIFGFLGLVLIFVFSACSGCSIGFENFSQEKNKVSIVSYNTQTFFDAMDNGYEFKQFRGNKTKWSKERYETRLIRLKDAVQLASFKLGFNEESLPDILVLQEIESTDVIADFCKLLPVHNSYSEAVFFPAKKRVAFNTAVLSKFPVIEAKQYHLYCKGVNLRPLLKLRIEIEIEDKKGEIILFAVHWKSKVGNVDSASIRKMQEQQLCRILTDVKANEPNIPFIICGDFNQPPEEFLNLKELQNCWDFEEYKDAVSFNIQPEGSYFFRDKWEAIDHFFYSENLSDGNSFDITKFAVINEIPLVTDEGFPKKYLVYSGSGYSDHLPIGIVLENLN